jgi:membrane protease YdiL (CAAX protease family)
MMVLSTTALSVVFAWLYSKSQGSLLLVILLHSAIDETLSRIQPPAQLASPLAFPADAASWFYVAFLWMSATYLLIQMRRNRR